MAFRTLAERKGNIVNKNYLSLIFLHEKEKNAFNNVILAVNINFPSPQGPLSRRASDGIDPAGSRTIGKMAACRSFLHGQSGKFIENSRY